MTRIHAIVNRSMSPGEALRAWRAGSAFVVGINLLSRILEVAEGSVDSLISRGPAKPCAAEETLISRVTGHQVDFCPDDPARYHWWPRRRRVPQQRSVSVLSLHCARPVKSAFNEV